jgi:hypothetical protein
MKSFKFLPVILLIGTLSTGSSVLFGQAAGDEAVKTVTQTMGGFGFRGFIDEDGNGISDYLEDADGDGVVNAHDPDSPLYRGEPGTLGRGRGMVFVDEDGNGISDYLEDADGDGVVNAHDPDSPLYRGEPGTLGRGRGMVFVDEDGNGISDYLEDADGDGVVNAHDTDSPLYRGEPGTLGRGRGLGFIDENGDGINDGLEDSDGDGVINMLDPDSDLYRVNSRGGMMRGSQRVRNTSLSGSSVQRGSAFGEKGTRGVGRMRGRK